MELRESIEHINSKLADKFGNYNDQPNFRVVFSEDQYEKRWTDRTDDGFQLLHKEVRELPKCKQWIHERFILERLIPVVGETDLIVPISYEPVFIFETQAGAYLPPRFDVCEIVIDTLHEQMRKAGTFTKYKDPEIDPEYRKQQLDDIISYLSGDETPVTDALAHGYGVTVPEMPKIEEKKETVN